MFAKLKTNLGTLEYSQLDKQIDYGRAISYFNVALPKLDEVMAVIPEKYRQSFSMSVMKINQSIPAHTDSGIKTTINFYVKTPPCKTVFYKTPTKPTTYQVLNQTNGVVFDDASLEERGFFIAKEGEVWVLDVTKPHAVEPLEDLEERVAITLATDTYYFDEVCSMLSDTGNM
jgi:hypothetical protein